MIKESAFYRYLRKIVYLLTIHPKEVKLENARKDSIDIRYENLKKFKNIYLGKRCFIVATGPSLVEEDYLKLKNEVTIGVNGLCLWFKEKKMETTYFVVSDDDVFKRIKTALCEVQKTEVFISERVSMTQEVPEQFYQFPVDIWNRFVLNEQEKRLSNDISICSYDEETVVFHAIQLAIYMGFKEIYLLGTDCNYNQSKKYAIDHGKKADRYLGSKMISAYQVAKRYETNYDFKILNATRGGMLEVFPRVNLDDVLNKEVRK